MYLTFMNLVFFLESKKTETFIKKVFLSMSHSLHTAYAHHFESFKMVGISSVKAMWHWKKNFLDKGFD